MSEWIEHTLGEVCSRLRSGSNITAKDIYESGSFRVFGGNGIRGYAGEANFSGECAIIGRQGAYCGNVRYFSGEARMSEHAIVACAGPSHDTRFLAYLLSTMNLGSLSGQAAQPGLSVKVLAQQSVRMPPLETQRRIAVILGAYDDLIEVNRRRVAVLEEIARGQFEELLRNPIEGFTIGELCEGSLGGDWGVEEADEEHSVEVRVVRGTDIPQLQSGNYSSCPSRFISSKSAAKRLLQCNDLVLENSINAKTRPAGNTFLFTKGSLNDLRGPAIAASFCRVFKFTSLRTALLVHHYCRYLHRTRQIERFQTVAANGIANFQTQLFLKECRLTIDAEANSAEVSLLESLHEACSLIGRQSSRLAASRDLLLPRLISGQLSVEAAERELENAA